MSQHPFSTSRTSINRSSDVLLHSIAGFGGGVVFAGGTGVAGFVGSAIGGDFASGATGFGVLEHPTTAIESKKRARESFIDHPLNVSFSDETEGSTSPALPRLDNF